MDATLPKTISLDGQSIASNVYVEPLHDSGQTQGEPAQLDQGAMLGSWTDPVDIDPYFDYTTFARPWNYHLDHTVDTSDWLSSQFFAALRETDLAYSPPFQTWTSVNHDTTAMDMLGIFDHNVIPSSNFSSHEVGGSLSSVPEPSHDLQAAAPLMDEPAEGLLRRTSGVASPPNESSHEDRLPFAWDPRSKRIARAKPIVLSTDDPIFAKIDHKVSVSQATLSRVEEFLRPLRPSSGEDTFIIPELPLVNVFISLFFDNFTPQAPVLHRQTVIVESLPSALLAIMMVIGSCYSRLRHTRRFGIIVLDRTRQNLLCSIEDDNSLMREPLIIYATALVCYMGLWCGNKRAFELAEALRPVVVTYIRRLPMDHRHRAHENFQGHAADAYGPVSAAAGVNASLTLQSQWLHWRTQESQKRLRWFVYMIDSQFPAILGMSGMLTFADIRKWECPCDEEFWAVATAKSWKNRLGSASEPSCPVFGSLTALLLSAPGPSASHDLLPTVNTWSANLLMTVIMSEVFHYQERLVVLRTYQEDPPLLTSSSLGSSHAACLLNMIDIWHSSYNEHQTGRPDTTSTNLQQCSTITYYLARLYLVFPVSEIQDCLGRSGPADSKTAMIRLGAWIDQCPEQAATVLEDASKCISIILANKGESGPYDLIGLFLCHIVIWSFAHVATLHQKEVMFLQLQGSQNILQSVLEVFEAGFLRRGKVDGTIDAPQLIFRHAIQSLVQLGTWGASSNLALLLYLHPGVSG
ncbi:uncharacterized protein M421DRAFT_422130 [Didymella exigua CBS 183.55]|uniref:Xylanolytic transcriptional activator regulatory domain-containing protein n=1 Tax=Didymella exigua CBS 183.55 TaxID=1150837 RepID=A0A6A5RMZ3_9PLEO|nr:uncharacterized protein M421DRAFT_422130 [Didymella exigua CBS 183.55]KAF1926887.1 hypothetical protein M421DRAFT_422130 [Didymella exigua CBS 183.55]